uniref:Uncharacterized protein n=1 Tax=Desertifilum tharense IPPAS B-1220 TaxID=1781255 RepID=A0ACD5H1B9_9CYAN
MQPWQESPRFPILPAADRNQFEAVYPQLCDRYPQFNPQYLAESLWHFWLPLALQVVGDRTSQQRPLIQGILGSQGTGKSTLAAILQLILAELGYSSLSLSLDDLYKTYRDRQHLQQQDPRWRWREPPGTHDVELGIAVLDALRQGETEVEVPRFDKSAYGGAGDRAQPQRVSPVDIVLFEGWFVGVRAIDPAAFESPLPYRYGKRSRLCPRHQRQTRRLSPPVAALRSPVDLLPKRLSPVFAMATASRTRSHRPRKNRNERSPNHRIRVLFLAELAPRTIYFTPNPRSKRRSRH